MSILTHVANHFAASAVVARDLTTTCDADTLLTRASELERMLDEFGIRSLALYADNSLDWIIVDLLGQHRGLVLLPLPTFFSAEQIEFTLNECPVDALLTDDPKELAAIEQLDARIVGPVPGSNLQLLVFNRPARRDVLPAGTGKITFTSGSTGKPRGVCLSHAQLERQALALRDRVGLQNQRHLCVLPLSTLLENVAGIYAPLLAGGEIIVPSQTELGFAGSSLVDAQQLLHTISAAQPDSLILVPELLLLLVAAARAGWRPPQSLRFIAVGGSKVAAELLAAAAELGLPVFEGYGLSECGPVVSLNTATANKPGSCGKPLDHVETDFDGAELVVRGNSMLGYVGDPASWNQAVVRTGDLGHLDADGFLHIDGRRKNLLISSFGRNISPEWVEAELLANPRLAEAVVLGDARPYCVALLSLRETADRSALEQWIQQVNRKLPDYARIRRWLLLPHPMSAMPALFTSNGRPKREAINKAFAAEIEALYRDEAVVA